MPRKSERARQGLAHTSGAQTYEQCIPIPRAIDMMSWIVYMALHIRAHNPVVTQAFYRGHKSTINWFVARPYEHPIVCYCSPLDSIQTDNRHKS